MSSSNSPCAACKLQRRKCTQECIYAPYFPPDQPQKFAYVHRVFGASNIAKLLVDLNTAHREDAVNSLAYEAEARLRDPVYGCVGLISFLQQNLKQIQLDLHAAKKELASYIGYTPQPQMAGPSSSSENPYDMSPMFTGQQEMLRNFEHQQRQQEFTRFNNGFDADGTAAAGAGGFNQMTADTPAAPSLTSGKFDNPF